MPALPPDDYPDTLDLLAVLFASLLDDAPWATFLDRLRNTAQASYATLILTPYAAYRPGLILTPGADPSVDADYASRIFTIDPFTGLPEGKVSRLLDFVADDAFKPAFREFMSSFEVLGVDIVLSDRIDARLRLTRAIDLPAFTPAEAARLQRLVPHVRVALSLFDRLATVQTEQRIYAGAIAQMAIGVIILDVHGKVVSVNTHAEAILTERDGIGLHDGMVVPVDPALARQLRVHIADPGKAGSLTLRIDRPSGAGDLLLVVDSASAPGRATTASGPATVLFLTDPARGRSVQAAAVRDLLGLTQAEAAVAALLADGLSPADAATRIGISPNTVRSHLRSIFNKTGVKRQSQLVQLVHHSLPGLGHPIR